MGERFLQKTGTSTPPLYLPPLPPLAIQDLRDLQESYPKSHDISYTHNVTPCTSPRTAPRSDRKTNVRFVISIVYNL
jgi:hypothetical protein